MKKITGQIIKHLELEKMSGTNELFVSGRKTRLKTEPMIDTLRKKIAKCTLCSLHKTRKQTVFGTGSSEASLMFVGEAPGADEDDQGEPFVGRAGQLLTKIIEAMGLKREQVYIANVLKCRPPNNRPPLPEEITICEGYLKNQIDIIKPKIICALGKFAAQTLLKTDVTISNLRGNIYEYNGIPLIPTFHPAYLLRNPPDKKLVWEDMQKIMRMLGLNK